ncbi:MAG: hypothetical protein JHC26_01955 [Thermofilum sp.]|jgi:hypothetical protein|uniref:hypothetical protein n=1 Tax=Thermofilum sp. TaxID=1961369 RepID=UPI002590D8E0|nr:hypothetical protein [Thermofilum sp.]MCI4407827.1 hypothetical protein [Thermofilum sp.]
MSIEIKVGKQSFPTVSIAKIEGDDDLLIVFLNGNIFWGQSMKTKAIAPLKFRGGKTVWGGKVVKFV